MFRSMTSLDPFCHTDRNFHLYYLEKLEYSIAAKLLLTL